jgi:hypothetical protein
VGAVREPPLQGCKMSPVSCQATHQHLAWQHTSELPRKTPVSSQTTHQCVPAERTGEFACCQARRAVCPPLLLILKSSAVFVKEMLGLLAAEDGRWAGLLRGWVGGREAGGSYTLHSFSAC